MVTDFPSVGMLCERLAHIYEDGEQLDERSSVVTVGDGRPVAGGRFRCTLMPSDPDPEYPSGGGRLAWVGSERS